MDGQPGFSASSPVAIGASTGFASPPGTRSTITASTAGSGRLMEPGRISMLA
ncbi:gamma-glutamyl:cysteine ligase YbdK (ATP-grasp superfamily) [Skermanella aerolata]|uniref:hypothetical protein n=1 Tax=Skermanella aerolata TaxID=393310 RepID=UPI003D25F5DD